MPLKFANAPTLTWRKLKRKNEDGDEEEVEVLCVCVKIENTGDTDEKTSVTFRGYIPDTGRPQGPNREDTLCENVAVKVPKHMTVEKCCCSYTRTVIEISNWGGWLVVEGDGIEKNATTDGTKLKIPERPKPE